MEDDQVMLLLEDIVLIGIGNGSNRLQAISHGTKHYKQTPYAGGLSIHVF